MQSGFGTPPNGKRDLLGHLYSVITTKKWYDELKKLSVGDQQWLEANMVVLEVKQALWQNPCELDSCEQAFSALQI